MQIVFPHLRWFAHHHDELPAFHAGYLVMTLLVASILNMGAFGLLILIHMCLDVVKYREVHGYSMKQVFEGVFRESLFDVTLLSVGLAFAVYLHHSVVGVASLSGLVRAEVTILRAIGTVIPKFHILHNFLKVAAHLHHYIESIHPRLQKGWNSVELFSIYCLILSVLLLLIAPSVLQLGPAEIELILREEIVPWRI